MSVQRKYLDFEVKIDDLGGGRYQATVIDMPLGEGQAQVSNDFTLPFSPDELNRILVIVSGRADVSTAERLRQARLFGETLFKTVFAGPVYTVYFSSRDRAQTADGLRIKLFLENAGAIANLPWELLRDPAVDFLALSRSTPLIRHPRRLVIRPRPVFTLPLRVLVMISSPSDLEPVDAKTEWEYLLTATATLREQGLLEVELLEDASLRTLQRMMRTREYHVFHYIGHSTFDPVTGQGMLALEDPFGEGSSFPVRGEDLARELGEENTIRLVVMNSCQSAVDLEGDPFAGIASSLVARGIPAVVAMQNVISEQAARVFSDELYRSVAEGLPVDAGVSEARRAISHVVGGIEWATPVLFMRAADGQLFDFDGKTEAAVTFRKPAVLAGMAGAVVLVVLAIAGLLLFDGNNGGTPTPVPPMDLAVDSVEVFPSRPAPGEKAGVFVAISNQSEAPVGSFGYDFRQDVLDQDVNLTGMVNGLAPGDMVTVLIPHYFSWWGAFVSEVRIDVESKVPETDEFNNISRYPIVTSSDPFSVLFDVLPDGTAIRQSMPLDETTFAAWNFRLEALPNGDPACENATPWIIVEGNTHYLGTGLPDTPDTCSNAPLLIVFEDQTVGGVAVRFEAVQQSEYSLVAFGDDGEEVDGVTEMFVNGTHELDVLSGLGSRLDIVQVEFQTRGASTHILGLELTEPAQLGLRR